MSPRSQGGKGRFKRGNVVAPASPEPPGTPGDSPEPAGPPAEPEPEPAATEHAASEPEPCEAMSPDAIEGAGQAISEPPSPVEPPEDGPRPTLPPVAPIAPPFPTAPVVAAALLVLVAVAVLAPWRSDGPAPAPPVATTLATRTRTAVEIPPAAAAEAWREAPQPPSSAAPVETKPKTRFAPALASLSLAAPPVASVASAMVELPPPPDAGPPPAAAPEPRVVVVEQAAGAEDQPRPSMRVGASTRGFDPIAAHAALDSVQPSGCWASGAAHGYGRARVVYGTNGAIQLVEIANPVQGAPPDRECIARKYSSASVPPFQGSNVTAYTTFFVR